jgi:xanthine dehydrogenase/oxidase
LTFFDVLHFFLKDPGLVEFYEYFAIELNKKTNHPIVGLSHTGHFYDDKLKSWKAVYLKTQVKDKVKFIQDYLFTDEIGGSLGVDKNTKIIFIGHSIGCYVILQILNTLDDRIKKSIKQTIHLFPTFERMALSPNGIKLKFISKYFSWFIYFVMFIVSLLPNLLNKKLIYYFFTKHHDKNLLANNIENFVC